MALMLKCGAVFLHIPKTGGKWVEKVLFEQGLVRCQIGDRHLTADGFRSFPKLERGTRGRSLTWMSREVLKRCYLERWERRAFRDAFVFCFVRHPITWYESYFKYNWMLAQRAGRQHWSRWGHYGTGDRRNFPHPWAMLDGTQAQTLSGFMRNVNRVRPGYVTEMYGWYTSWDYESQVSFIGKQERLTDDLITVLSQLNVNFDEDQIRNTPKSNASKQYAETDWDPGLREETERMETVGIARYGYAKSSGIETPDSLHDVTPTSAHALDS